jgi:TRAP-type C4-dicarboxylate transport system permease small subunit
VILQPVLRVLHRTEDALLVSALVSMLVMALVQILLRNFFDLGLFWAESFLRILVLWVAMLGAMVATRESNHIAIDLVSRYLPVTPRRITTFVTHCFSAVICALVAFYAVEFIQYEYEDKTIAFANVPTWICQSIIPIGFSVMAVRFIINGVRGFFK